jgi:hypothetical protein
MDRRALIQAGTFAFAAASAPAALAQAPAGPARKISACSRHLQWLRTGDEVGKACIDMAFDGLDVTVGPAPAHVDPARVRRICLLS